MGFGFADHIFLWFPTGFLGALSFLVALIHIYKYYCKKEMWCAPEGKRAAYLVRSLNWFVFGIALFLFPHLELIQARATLRIALAFMILSELGYNLTYVADMIKDLPKLPEATRQKLSELNQWTRKLLRL